MADIRPPRPVALKVRPEGIPDALKAERRWTTWRYELRKGKNSWVKIPCQTNGAYAESDNPSTWTTFAAALAANERGSFDGIGFCLGDGWCGIDLDKCVDLDAATGFLNALNHLHAYWELSPSGTGYKAIGRSARMGGEINFRTDTRTSWQGARFFATTGHRWSADDQLVDLTGVIDAWFPTDVRPSRSRTATPRPDFIQEGDRRGTALIERRTDDEVLLAAATATNREKFLRLFRGDLSDYGGDRSRADQALACILVYWCGGDVEQADRLFRMSALYRDKWEVRSYRMVTLDKAAAMLREAL